MSPGPRYEKSVTHLNLNLDCLQFQNVLMSPPVCCLLATAASAALMIFALPGLATASMASNWGTAGAGPGPRGVGGGGGRGGRGDCGAGLTFICWRVRISCSRFSFSFFLLSSDWNSLLCFSSFSASFSASSSLGEPANTAGTGAGRARG